MNSQTKLLIIISLSLFSQLGFAASKTISPERDELKYVAKEALADYTSIAKNIREMLNDQNLLAAMQSSSAIAKLD